jgi:hypothetical protein
MSTPPVERKTTFTVEMFNSKTEAWNRAQGPYDDENRAYHELDVVKSVIKGYHERGTFTGFTRVRLRKDVTETFIIADEGIEEDE